MYWVPCHHSHLWAGYWTDLNGPQFSEVSTCGKLFLSIVFFSYTMSVSAA